MKITNNKKIEIYLKNILCATAFIGLIACEGKYNPRVEDVSVAVTDSFQRVKTSQDNSRVENESAYTYIIDPEEMVFPVVTADSVSGDSSNEMLSPIAIVVQSTRKDIEENRPPLYGEECLEQPFPVRCSSDNISAFVRENLEFPESATGQTVQGIEMVTIRVSKEGKISDVKIESSESNCDSCKEAAYSVVSSMPAQWLPALKDGKPVSTRITIPIEFKTLN